MPNASFSAILGALLLSSTVLSCATPQDPIEVLAVLDVRPGNPAVTADGRLLFSQHPMDEPVYKVMELTSDGSVVPFPTRSWSRDRMGAVLGIEARSNGLVWMLDMGGGGLSPKLVAWDVNRKQLAHQIQIPASVRVEASFLQDMTILEKHGVVVIADMTMPGPFETPTPALIVVDIEMGSARRVLEGHASFMPTLDRISIGGDRLRRTTKGGDVRDMSLALNPITADPSQEWVYFGAMSGERIYRMPAASLANPELGDDALASLVEDYAPKAASDGFRVDGAGRIFVTDLEASGIGIATPSGYEVIISDAERFPWPDGLAFDGDGALIVTVNQLHLHPNLHGGEEASRPPYAILRLNGVKARK